VITHEQAATFERCMAVGGVAVFPADTVYGLACEPDNRDAVYRLYDLKGRRPDKPAAVMFFSLELALAAVPEAGPRTVAAVEALLPGAVTVLLPNPAGRFPLACGPVPGVLGLRVPALPPALEALQTVHWPVLQSSANLAGRPDARRLADVDAAVRDGADLLLDGGELPGLASSVVDLCSYERDGSWTLLREGALGAEAVAAALAS
jgi:L-threonylcarbamoyladenylate synthase